MKTTTLMIIGTLIGASAFATAQDKPKRDGRGPGGGGGFPPEVIEKFDTDKDGKLSKEERQAARAAREKEFDKDGDGKLNDEEKKAMHEDGRKKLIARFDKDGDGKLSDEEKAAIPKPPKGDGPDGDKPEKPDDKKPEGQ